MASLIKRRREAPFSLPGFYRLALLAGFAGLVLARLPHIAEQGGRFWAEEGVFYFRNAMNLPWWRAWFAVLPDYINLVPALGTWLALRLGGIAHAPLVTGLIALCVQALPPGIILTHDFPWRRSWLGCLVAVALCALPPVTGEVWLNTITSQFHLALAAALILAAPARRGRLLLFDAVVLGLASLSGPATTFLMPLFLLRAAVTRGKADIALGSIVFAGFCIQAALFFAYPQPLRDGNLSLPELCAAVSLHVVTLEFAGFRAALLLSGWMLRQYAGHGFLWPGLLIVFLFYAALIWIITGCRRHAPALSLLLGAQILFSFISFDKAIGGGFIHLMDVIGGQRYAFAPMVLTGLILTGGACAASGLRRAFCVAALCLGIFTALRDFRAGTELFAEGPDWAGQIAQWRHNPQMVLHVWPAGWVMTLPPPDRSAFYNF
ncbi:hypothetical protein [Acidocella sp.]|uniref:hypothetical protein n=1 Tax=Acidocella sp. TaxID=50710 RepID=UPI0026333B01|nr:hypothetical protein [Acidocella sp.]